MAGGCGLINHNHHDSERLELCFGTGIWLFLDRENKISKRRKSVRIIVLLVLSGRLSNCRIFFLVLTGMEKKGNLTSRIVRQWNCCYDFWTVNRERCIVSTGASVATQRCRSLWKNKLITSYIVKQ